MGYLPRRKSQTEKRGGLGDSLDAKPTDERWTDYGGDGCGKGPDKLVFSHSTK